jgi:HlyD family secretion protein
MKSFFTKKKIAVLVLVLLVVGYFVFRKGNVVDPASIQTEFVKKQDLKQTVLSTGQVTSETDLSLSFKTSGIVQKVNAKVGSTVKAGEVLATLDQKDVLAKLTQARGSLAQAKASYQKVLDGASGEEVAVSQRAVDASKVNLENAKNVLETTKSQQKVLVANAYSALLNTSVTAISKTSNISPAVPTISGTYLGAEQGSYVVTITSGGSSPSFSIEGLEIGGGPANTNTTSALGTKGLFIQFASPLYLSDSWTINIPNSKASTYVTNYNVYQSALETQKTAIANAQNAISSAQVALEQAEAALNLKKSQARSADIQVAEAGVLTAQGQVQAVEAEAENALLRAPSSGTITSVDIKVGELATALKQAMVLLDITNLHVESDISEANISSIKVGQTVNIDFDSLGSDRKFTAMVQKVDPASTLVSGVVKYKITVGLEKIDEIKPGMTANLNIITGEKKNVLVVPLRSIISRDGKKYIRIISDTKTKKYEEKEVVTGMEGDGGLVEIVSGLTEGQEVVVYIKPK